MELKNRRARLGDISQYSPLLKRLRQGDHKFTWATDEFKAILSYGVRLCLTI